MKENYYINGIQQIGLGITDLYPSWQWYIDTFHFDLPVFDEKAEAKLMLPYTEGKPRTRHAVLALNYQGGGGLEIWNHVSFTPRKPLNKVKPGDLGIFALHIKVKDIQESYNRLKKLKRNILTEITTSKSDNFFYLMDPFENMIKVIQANDWHTDVGLHSGGVYGCSIGVSDMKTSIEFYKDILGYDVIVSDHSGEILEYDNMGFKGNYRKVILKHSRERSGAFSNLLGKSQIELVQLMDGKANTIFEGRMWGELGYIHLCFDVENMHILEEKCKEYGSPFTVDSANSFDMGEAAGRFAYIEDPDGTLIEFVETHKIPILKKIGWYFNLKKRKAQKPLSGLILKAMSLNRVKKPVTNK